MLKRILTIALLTLFSLPAHSDSLESLSQKTQFFYQNPSAELFEEIQDEAQRHKKTLLKKDRASAALLAVFVARVHEKYDWPITGTFLRFPAKHILDENYRLYPHINDDKNVSPIKIEIWWSSFFATGEAQYLQLISDMALREIVTAEPGLWSESERREWYTVQAAAWSFIHNCRKHETLRNFALGALKHSDLPEKKASFLKRCMAPVSG